jgi:hypothetical protein
MIEYLQFFFSPDHLFSLRPGVMQPRALIILGVIFGGLLLGGVATMLVTKKTRDGLKIKGYRRLTSLFFTIGSLGIVYMFFASQRAVLLAARFWLLVLLIVGAVWLSFIINYLFRVVPKKRQSLTQKRQFEKYLP